MAALVVAAEIQEIAGPGILQVLNLLAEAVGRDAKLRRISRPLDIPELQEIKEVRE